MAKPTELSRAERKSKKRALEDAIPDLPGDDAAADNTNTYNSDGGDGGEKKSKKRKRDRDAEGEVEVNEGEGEKKKSKKEKKSKSKTEEDIAEEIPEEKVSKKSKKEKKDKAPKGEVESESADVVMPDADAGTEGKAEVEAGEVPKKSKKERKAERRAAELAAAKDGSSVPSKAKSGSAKTEKDVEGESKGEKKEAGAVVADGEKKRKNNRNREKKRNANLEAVAGTGTKTGEAKEGAEEKNHRFIVFVGNLPFTATKDSIRKHFASVSPKSIRPMTDKQQPTKCKGTAFVEFEGYDHMKTCLKMFHHSEFNDGISAARKINVELTVGGGGNTKNRKAKLTEKNEKLNEQRVRRLQEEEKAKLAKPKGAGAEKAVDESAIHPSRRRMVPGAAAAGGA